MLLPSPRRAGNGYRYYDEADVERLAFVVRARELGFLAALAAGQGGRTGVPEAAPSYGANP